MPAVGFALFCHSLARVSSLLLRNALFHPLWVRSFVIHHVVLDLKLLCLIVDNPLFLIDRSSGFLSFSPSSSNLALFAQTVGFSWSCVRTTASLRLRTLFHVLRDQSTRTTHSVSTELFCSGSSLLSKQLQHCLSAELFRFSLLFQLHFVVVYSAVLADSTSGTSDTTA